MTSNASVEAFVKINQETINEINKQTSIQEITNKQTAKHLNEIWNFLHADLEN